MFLGKFHCTPLSVGIAGNVSSKTFFSLLKYEIIIAYVLFCKLFCILGIARTQFPTNINFAPELPTFGAIADFSQAGVQ